MADFCEQCSIETFGEDSGDLASPNRPEIKRYYTLCEGCGPTVVDAKGHCIGACSLRHGDVPVQTLREFVDGKLPGR